MSPKVFGKRNSPDGQVWMQLEWHPGDLEVETSLLMQPVDETLADIAERSYVIKEHVHLDHC